MSFSGCEDFLWWFSKRQESDMEFRSNLIEAMDSPFDPMGRAARLIAATDPAIAPVVEMEFRELPRIAMKGLLDAWRESVDAGIRFEAHSVVPSNPLEFARKRRVRLVVDREEDAIHVALSHIPTRHPRVSASGV